MKSPLKSLLASLALSVALLAPAAAQADTLKLKDGRTLDGTVVREQDGYVWFKVKVGGLESEQFFKPDQIDKLEKDAGSATPAKPAPSDKPATDPASKGASGAPRAAIISLGDGHDKDMVGLFITSDELERCIPLLEEEKVEIVVFRINSGGGALLEIQKLSDVIEYKFKPKFRVVSWIESAISAAAMTSHCIEEIYMMPGGNYGACTGWSGQLVAVKGRQLQEVLYMMEKISARGKHPKEIMRAMQIMDPLSCSIDENGDVHWYQNTDGEFVVNPPERILTFTSETAMKYKFAKGIAGTYEELGKAMGLSEVEWVGKRVPGIPYPQCRAEAEMRRFRDQTLSDQEKLNSYAREYNQSIAIAEGSPPAERGKFVNRARQALDNIKKMVKNNPNMALFQMNMLPEQFKDWLDQQEERLRKLTKK